MGDNSAKRIVVGISGASGIPIAVHLLKAMRDMPGLETHLVISEGAGRTVSEETDLTVEEIAAFADCVYESSDPGAPVASGSFRTDGMIVVPCSMKTLAGIACGYADNLLLRAADVTLKERRRLVLVTRETPLNLIHIENMERVTRAGAIVLPPVPAFYTKPETVDDILRGFTGRILECFGLEYPEYRRWRG